MTSPFMSMTWQAPLMRRPARASWTAGVAHAAKKGGFSDPMPWGWLVEIGIDSAFDKGIVPHHGLFEIGWRHRHTLILHDDLPREVGEPVSAEKEAGSDVDVRRLR